MPRPSPARPDTASSTAQIRAAGVKVTRHRVRVLDALRAAGQPLAHADIDTQLGAVAESTIDRVTLYRILDSLVACGLAVRALDPRGVFRFSSTEVQHRHQGHVHFRCLVCGGVFCLDARPPRPPRLPAGFSLREIEFDLRGTCPACGPDQAV